MGWRDARPRACEAHSAPLDRLQDGVRVTVEGWILSRRRLFVALAALNTGPISPPLSPLDSREPIAIFLMSGILSSISLWAHPIGACAPEHIVAASRCAPGQLEIKNSRCPHSLAHRSRQGAKTAQAAPCSNAGLFPLSPKARPVRKSSPYVSASRYLSPESFPALVTRFSLRLLRTARR